MASENLLAALEMLLSESGEDAAQVYARHFGLDVDGGRSLEDLVRENLIARGKGSQLRESLLETLHAGGATGESVQACLMRTGLVGWE